LTNNIYPTEEESDPERKAELLDHVKLRAETYGADSSGWGWQLLLYSPQKHTLAFSDATVF
jgi:hypothetical protein